MRFAAGSARLEVTGGDGFERDQLATVELAKNCLNAGLWEVQLYAHQVEPASGGPPLDELELVFTSSREPGTRRFLVSGFDARALPQLAVSDYSRGLTMPLGISPPPFGQDVTELEQKPPPKSPYFSLLLDQEGRWINHHRVAIDGVVLHRDAADPDLLHLYLLSYERASLIGHWRVRLPASAPAVAAS